MTHCDICIHQVFKMKWKTDQFGRRKVVRQATIRDALTPIIGRFADNQYWPTITAVSANCRLHSW